MASLGRSATTRSRSASTERALLHDVRELIVEARTRVVRATNVTLTLTYWRIGERIRRVVLGDKRADYGRHVIERLATHLTQEFGDGFSRANLFNIVRFAEVFADPQIVQTLSGQLTWSHFCILIYQEKPLQREFYAAMCADQHWNVRELRRQIQGMLYERVALSKKPEAVVDRAIKALRDTAAGRDDVYEWGSGWVSVESADGTRSKQGGRYLTVWHRQPDGAWVIIRNLAF